jgi:hypothetical protein
MSQITSPSRQLSPTISAHKPVNQPSADVQNAKYSGGLLPWPVGIIRRSEFEEFEYGAESAFSK